MTKEYFLAKLEKIGVEKDLKQLALKLIAILFLLICYNIVDEKEERSWKKRIN